MKAKDLFEILQSNPELEVVLQRDPEGNGYAPLRGADSNTVYAPGSGEVYIKELTDELKNSGFSEEDLCPEDEKSIPCIVLHPMY